MFLSTLFSWQQFINVKSSENMGVLVSLGLVWRGLSIFINSSQITILYLWGFGFLDGRLHFLLALQTEVHFGLAFFET